MYVFDPAVSVVEQETSSYDLSNNKQSLNNIATTVGDTKDESSPTVRNNYNILRSQQLKLSSYGAANILRSKQLDNNTSCFGDNNGSFGNVTQTTPLHTSHHRSVLNFYEQHNSLIDSSNPLPLNYNHISYFDTIFIGCTTESESDFGLYFDTVFEDRTGNNDNYYGDTVSNSVIVMLKTYDTIYDLYFNTVITIIVAVAPAVAVFITLLSSYIIDHGSVVYLILLQIRFYDQQYSLLLLGNSNNGTNDQSSYYRNSVHFGSAAMTIYGNNDDVYHVVMKVYHMTNGTIVSVSVSVATKATFPVGMMKSYNQYNLYFRTKVNTAFNTVFATVFDAAVTTDIAYNTAVSVVTKISFTNYNEDSSSDSLSSAIYDEDSFAANDHSVAVTTKTYNMPSAIHNEISSAVSDVISSATFAYEEIYDMMIHEFVTTSSTVSVADRAAFSIVMMKSYNQYNLYYDTTFVTAFISAVTIMTNTIKMMTNGMNTEVYFAIVDEKSSADITNTTTLYLSPSYDIDVDTESFAVSVVDEAMSAVTKTPTVSCHSSNYFSQNNTLDYNFSTSFDF